LPNPSALTLEHPLDIQDARVASRRLADQRRAAEEDLERLTQDAAEKEAAYRRALAEAFTRAEGTAKAQEAAARAAVADKSYERDLAAGMVKVQAERLRGLEGERSMLKSLVEWSARINEETRERYGQRASDEMAAAR
jgi:hypothetical protein